MIETEEFSGSSSRRSLCSPLTLTATALLASPVPIDLARSKPFNPGQLITWFNFFRSGISSESETIIKSSSDASLIPFPEIAFSIFRIEYVPTFGNIY